MRKGGAPERHAVISWLIIAVGVVIVLIGAGVMQNYEMNWLIWAGGIVVLTGIIWYWAAVRCPYCGHSLIGYRPLPEECPKCHKKFSEL